jgi:hypothetical protein
MAVGAGVLSFFWHLRMPATRWESQAGSQVLQPIPTGLMV